MRGLAIDFKSLVYFDSVSVLFSCGALAMLMGSVFKPMNSIIQSLKSSLRMISAMIGFWAIAMIGLALLNVSLFGQEHRNYSNVLVSFIDTLYSPMFVTTRMDLAASSWSKFVLWLISMFAYFFLYLILPLGVYRTVSIKEHTFIELSNAVDERELTEEKLRRDGVSITKIGLIRLREWSQEWIPCPKWR